MASAARGRFARVIPWLVSTSKARHSDQISSGTTLTARFAGQAVIQRVSRLCWIVRALEAVANDSRQGELAGRRHHAPQVTAMPGRNGPISSTIRSDRDVRHSGAAASGRERRNTPHVGERLLLHSAADRRRRSRTRDSRSGFIFSTDGKCRRRNLPLMTIRLSVT